MSKFKCTEYSRDFVEVLRDKEGRPALTVGDNHSASVAFIAPSDAPALALAILEAAGFTEESPNFGTAVHELGLAVKEQDYITAEAEAQAKLEAEALELENAGREAAGAPLVESMSYMTASGRKVMLAVARRAREMRAEK